MANQCSSKKEIRQVKRVSQAASKAALTKKERMSQYSICDKNVI
jgi:hypothetical protein